MSKKRRREQPSFDVELIDIFEDLANEDGEIRLKAAKGLLSKTSHENDPSTQLLEKVLRRLIRGLCSGRKAARLGFSVALTEFLVQTLGSGHENTMTGGVSELIGTVEKETQIGGNSSGQEERDHYFGRLFGAEAIIKSGILFRSGQGFESWERVLDLIYLLAKKKSWLREECGWVMYGALKSLSIHGDSITYAQTLLDKLHLNGLAKTSEGVAIWITASSLFPTLQKPKGIWKNDDPLDRKEKMGLALILKESSVEASKSEGETIARKGTWTSKLHFAWDVVLKSLPKTREVDITIHAKRITFKDFWIEAVDNILFATSSSNERKYWGFLLFQQYIQDAPEGILSVLFGKNFMRCLINQLASPERYLHRIAEKSLKAIHSRASSEPNLVPIVVENLMGLNGDIGFDLVTKTKTIERLLAAIDLHTLGMIISLFNQMIMHPQVEDEKFASTKRQVLADYLLTVVRSKSNQNESEKIVVDLRGAISQILDIFIQHAYFEIRDKSDKPEISPSPSISQTSREMFRSRIISCLTHLMPKAMDVSYYPYYVFSQIQSKKELDGSTFIVFHADESIDKEIKRACKTLDKIQEKEKSAIKGRKSYFSSFKLLYSLILLQVYNGDADAVNILSELKECYQHLLKHPTANRQGEGSEILVEIILSLLSKPSLLFKQLAQQVLSTCTSSLTAESIGSLIRVLETNETISGQADMFEGPDDESDDIDMSDVEEISAIDDDIKSTSALDESEAEPSSSSMEEGTDDELVAFDAKLAQALGTRSGNEDLIASDNESSDEDMNDEQMEALDEHIGNIFRERKKLTSKKKQKKDAKETIVLFKSRVLELLEIYIKQQYLNILAIDLIIPLLTIIHNTTSKPVSEKACSLIREYSKLYKLKDKISSGADKDDPQVGRLELLDTIHEAAVREGSNAYGSACSQASILMAKIHISNGGNVADVLKRYADTQELFFKNPKCPIKTSFFSDWLNWCSSARKNHVS